MSIDAEQLRHRRQQRKKEQQAKKAKRRKLLLLIAIAAVVIGIGLAIVLGGSSAEPAPSTEASSDPAPERAPATVIHFAMAGDLNVTDSSVASGGSNYDYTNAFLDVAHILADADIAAVNFEGNLLDAPYGTQSKSAPQSMMQALSAAGVDVVQLANSYSIHSGIAGLQRTISGVRSAGMIPLGVYASNAQFESSGGYTVLEVKGVRVALVAFTKGMDGMALPEGNEQCVNVLYSDYDSTYQKVNTAGIRSILQAVEKEKPDITIALLHWGSEFNDTISASQKDIEELLHAEGVDAIIGTHAHYVQQMKLTDDGKFTAYSLGDFFGDAAQAGSDYSVILDLQISKDPETGITTITDFTYTPIYTVTSPDAPSRVVRIHQAMREYESGALHRVSAATYDAMAYALTRIEARISGKG